MTSISSVNQLTIAIGLLGAQFMNWWIAQPVPQSATPLMLIGAAGLATVYMFVGLSYQLNFQGPRRSFFTLAGTPTR